MQPSQKSAPAPLFQRRILCLAIGGLAASGVLAQSAAPVPEAPVPADQPLLLDPVSVPKYVIPLVIPPEMPKSKKTTEPCPRGAKCPETMYNIAVREFRQQILPGGIWNPAKDPALGSFPPTTVWSYGSAADPLPPGQVAPAPAMQSSFNYPAFTMETKSQQATTVRWINELVNIDPATGKPYPLSDNKNRTFKKHLLAIDRTLHFANPEQLTCTDPISGGPGAKSTNCRPYLNRAAPDPLLGQPYDGPVPMVVHVHGAEVNPYSDGYPESWWLPAAGNIGGYAPRGDHYDQFPGFRSNTYPGSAVYKYENTQPASTLWYHEHSLGMTANNVYAGPAGFWLVRGDYKGSSGVKVPEKPVRGKLPGDFAGGRPTNPTQSGCDPNFDAVCRAKIREIPIVVQDRSFKPDGELFYPTSRDYFDGWKVPYMPDAASDVSPIHNPEFFGNSIVVNGTVWPTFDVVAQRYRLRMLAGGDARSFNFSLWAIPPDAKLPDTTSATYIRDLKAVAKELPIYQIGAEQGSLPQVVKIMSGTTVVLPGNGTEPAASCTPADPNANPPVAGSDPKDPSCNIALAMAPAERADVIVDFSGLPTGTRVRMINTGPDVPFYGYDVALADRADARGTGQVMEFVVRDPGPNTPVDTSTPPSKLLLSSEPDNNSPVAAKRRAALVEEDSKRLCVVVDDTLAVPSIAHMPGMEPPCVAPAVPFGPTEVFVKAVTTTDPVRSTVQPLDQRWADPITEAPTRGDTEVWEIYNFTVDAHPMHLHGARVEVVDRQKLSFDLPNNTATPIGNPEPARPTEAGYKDTVVALPGYVSRIRAKFEIPGLYVWHCHIVEHEDNEMMVPICIKNSATDTACNAAPGGTPWPITNGGAGMTH